MFAVRFLHCPFVAFFQWLQNIVASLCPNLPVSSLDNSRDYETCTSTDSTLHCFDPKRGQVCCADGNGKACDSGYYCASDVNGGTQCCPNDSTFSQCAALVSVSVGSLTSKHLSTTQTQTTTVVQVVTITQAAETSSPTSSTSISASGHVGNSTISGGGLPAYTGGAGTSSETSAFTGMVGFLGVLVGSLMMV